jgi:hypothetical protein
MSVSPRPEDRAEPDYLRLRRQYAAEREAKNKSGGANSETVRPEEHAERLDGDES